MYKIISIRNLRVRENDRIMRYSFIKFYLFAFLVVLKKKIAIRSKLDVEIMTSCDYC